MRIMPIMLFILILASCQSIQKEMVKEKPKEVEIMESDISDIELVKEYIKNHYSSIEKRINTIAHIALPDPYCIEGLKLYRVMLYQNLAMDPVPPPESRIFIVTSDGDVATSYELKEILKKMNIVPHSEEEAANIAVAINLYYESVVALGPDSLTSSGEDSIYQANIPKNIRGKVIKPIAQKHDNYYEVTLYTFEKTSEAISFIRRKAIYSLKKVKMKIGEGNFDIEEFTEWATPLE